MVSRFENIKNLYRQSLSYELLSFAESEKDEDLEELAKELTSNKPVKEVVQKPEEEEEEFVPPENIGEMLGAGPAPKKKTPILPHREVGKTLDVTLPTEMETSKYTPGAIKGKVCDICGRFNFPPWKKECSYCKRIYNFMRDLVDLKGLTPAKAAKLIASGQTRPMKEDEFVGVVTSPERLPVKKTHYLTEDQLKEIWQKGGKILLPELPETLDQQFEDKRGLPGIPTSIKMQNALETQLNVEKIEKNVYDPKTGKTFKTKDVYFNQDGEPVPVKYSKRDFFSLADIAKKLKMDVNGVLKGISEYNDEHGTEIKPVRYYDELNQIFSWKNNIEPVFKDRIKEVYEMFRNTYLANLARRKEKLDEDILNLELTIGMLKKNKENVRKEIESLADKKDLATLFKLRKDAEEIVKKINKLKDDKQKPTLIESLNKINETKAPLEKKHGRMLDSFVNKVQVATDELIRTVKRIERMKQSRNKIVEQANDYITAVGKPGDVPENINPADLQKAQTGHSGQAGGDIDLDDLASQIANEKKANKVNKLLKMAGTEKWWESETKEEKPLEGQLGFPFPEYDERSKKRHEGLKTILREPTKQEEEEFEKKIVRIMKSKLIQDEAEDRLIAANDPLADEENLTLKQKIERNKKIRQLMLESPTREEAEARIESSESKPLPFKTKEFVPEPKEMKTEVYEERPCPYCNENKVVKGSERCSNCGFISAPNRKDVVIERTVFKLVYDKDGNPIPKLDASGVQMLDDRGMPMFKKRPEKQLSLVSIQFDDFGQPKWAQARKISSVTPDPGAKTKEERDKFYEKVGKEPPKVREMKPITKKPEDFRTIYDWKVDEETGKEQKVDTGKKEHKQKCKGCPEPWIKIKLEEFGEYPTVENAYKFTKGEDMDANTKAWNFKEIYQPKEEKIDRPLIQQPTILPLASNRFNRILKLSLK